MPNQIEERELQMRIFFIRVRNELHATPCRGRFEADPPGHAPLDAHRQRRRQRIQHTLGVTEGKGADHAQIGDTRIAAEIAVSIARQFDEEILQALVVGQ